MVQKAIAAALGVYIGWKFLDSKLQLSADLDVLKRMGAIKKQIDQHMNDGYNVGQWWEDAVAKFGNKTSLVFEGKSYTYVELDRRINQMANWLLSKGYKKGDVGAIFMENCTEYIIAYLAFAKIGMVSALINNNLRQKGLVHCVSVSKSKLLVYGSDGSALADVVPEMDSLGISLLCFGPSEAPVGHLINSDVEAQPTTAPSKSHRDGVGFLDQFAYIYTSGTTGLPKAAVIRHMRMFLFGASMFHGYKLNENDINYCVLPLYHSSACLGVGAMIHGGVTLVLRRKFSVNAFWKEAAESKATVTQYIGELCRYLLNQPPGEYDRAHKLRIAIGNGLRPEIWGSFQERFNIPIIGEFYGATEGNATLSQICETKEARGAVGRQGYLMKKITGLKIVRFDVEKEEVVRGKDGFCIECENGEAGELCGPIVESNPLSHFVGYTDPKATEKKVLRDAFVKGDKYMRTGDLLMRDSRGYYYFVDRIGDTFRWKGENVSTTEVAEVLSVFPGVHEANVYGVQIPMKDGRACMAGLVADKALDLVALLNHCKKELPPYAVPMFIRILEQIEITGTFKHQKVQLRKEGVDLEVVKDPIYWLNPSTNRYEPFTQASWASISSGKAKL